MEDEQVPLSLDKKKVTLLLKSISVMVVELIVLGRFIREPSTEDCGFKSFNIFPASFLWSCTHSS
jgi:hypothetical protein